MGMGMGMGRGAGMDMGIESKAGMGRMPPKPPMGGIQAGVKGLSFGGAGGGESF
jgi:hypothetical protein